MEFGIIYVTNTLEIKANNAFSDLTSIGISDFRMQLTYSIFWHFSGKHTSIF